MKLFLAGIFIIFIFWFMAWSRIPVLTEYSFFPLWLGYVLAMNGLSELVFHESLLKRMKTLFWALFLISIPFWWFFEYLNSIVQNWHYLLAEPISALHYTLQASIDFSVVVPAVLSTTFFFNCLLAEKIFFSKARPLNFSVISLSLIFLIGLGLLGLLPIFPKELFSVIWLAPFLVLEPLLYLFQVPSLFSKIKVGDWRLTLAIMAATLFNGFWWEWWNLHSLPKWFYTIPYVGFWKIFEMPLLGYLGYPFFGLLLFSYTTLIFFLIFRKNLLGFFE